MTPPTYRPVIIVGAPRSGTNMLRDALTTLPGWATWPCDEINYIWRHGNVRHPSDEFTPAQARPTVARYIRGRFDAMAQAARCAVLVEKTCATSLRVPFVDRVVPEARYIFIHRDGYDAVGSALHRWKADLDLPYLARKARFVPLTDIPYYATRFIGNRIARLLSPEDRLAFWGPQLEGMSELLQRHTLEEVCAMQWQRCADRALEALRAIPATRWVQVSYETLVRAPETELPRIVHAIGLAATDAELAGARRGIAQTSIGKGRQQLGPERVRQLAPVIDPTLARLGYA